MWSEVLDKEDQISEIASEENNLKKQKKELVENNRKTFIIMMIINMIFILLLPLCSMSLLAATIISIEFSGLLTAATVLTLCGINTLLGYGKTKANENKIKSLNEQIKYIIEVRKTLENEILDSKKEQKERVKFGKINNTIDWKKHLKLIKVYNKYKKAFKKHYKKGDLYEVLRYNGYSNPDTYYLYNRTKKEVELKGSQKVLKKNKVKGDILELWK